MKKSISRRLCKTFFMVAIWCLLISPLMADNTIKVYSGRDAFVWVNSIKVATIRANSDPLEMRFTRPGGYTIQVRDQNSTQVHSEEIVVNDFAEMKKTIRAFSSQENAEAKLPETEMPPPWMMPQGSPMSYQPTTPYQPVTSYTPMDSAAEMTRAVEAARQEYLQRENGRRQRENEREAARQVLFHLLAVEHGKGVGEKSKQLERKRLLSGKLWNSLFKKW